MGPASALLSGLFLPQYVQPELTFAHSLAVTIFGGFTPAIISGLANYTGSNLSVALRLIFSAVLSSVSLLAVQDRSRMELL